MGLNDVLNTHSWGRRGQKKQRRNLVFMCVVLGFFLFSGFRLGFLLFSLGFRSIIVRFSFVFLSFFSTAIICLLKVCDVLHFQTFVIVYFDFFDTLMFDSFLDFLDFRTLFFCPTHKCVFSKLSLRPFVLLRLLRLFSHTIG